MAGIVTSTLCHTKRPTARNAQSKRSSYVFRLRDGHGTAKSTNQLPCDYCDAPIFQCSALSRTMFCSPPRGVGTSTKTTYEEKKYEHTTLFIKAFVHKVIEVDGKK